MRAYVLLANGFEEIEAITPIDVLRRAGFDVTTLSIHDSKKITGAHNVIIAADGLLSDYLNESPDIIITPGGMPGSTNLKESNLVIEIIKKQVSENRHVASICASPIVLDEADVLNTKNYTCYPGFEKVIKSGNYSDDRVVSDNKIITAKGPGVAIEFALKIVEELLGENVSNDLKKAMIVK